MKAKTLSLLMVLLLSGWVISCGGPTAEMETPAATWALHATAQEWKAGGEPGDGARLSLGHRLGESSLSPRDAGGRMSGRYKIGGKLYAGSEEENHVGKRPLAGTRELSHR